MKRHPDDGWVLADPAPMGAGTSRALRGLIRALCWMPAGCDDAMQHRVELHVRRMLRYLPPGAAWLFALSIHALDLCPMWLGLGLRRLQSLERDQAEAVIERVAHSRSVLVRTLLLGVRTLTQSTFYDQDEVHAAIGVEPVPFVRERIAVRERLLGERELLRRRQTS